MLQQVCPSGDTTPGIDIYHGNYIEDINQVIATGVKYAYLKAWEYTLDPSFKSRWEAMRNHGIIRGAYDFFHPAKDPIAQAMSFLATMDSYLPDDLPMALDWEVTDGMTITTDCDNALKWLAYIEQKTGKTPVIYMSSAFMPLDERFARFGLWVANYNVKCPHVPTGRAGWNFWQGASANLMPGMRGPVDTDVFNGSLDDLKAFVANSKLKVV